VTEPTIAKFVVSHCGHGRSGPLAIEEAYRPLEIIQRRRQRKPSLTRLVAKARQLGVDVTVEPNGTVTFRCSSAAPDVVINEWDEVLPRHGAH